MPFNVIRGNILGYRLNTNVTGGVHAPDEKI